jgi:hypothetical protein
MKTYQQFIQESELDLIFGVLLIQAIAGKLRHRAIVKKNKALKKEIDKEIRRLEVLVKKDNSIKEGVGDKFKKVGKKVKSYIRKRLNDIKKYAKDNPDKIVDIGERAALYVFFSIIDKINKKEQLVKEYEKISKGKNVYYGDIDGVVSKSLESLEK